MLKIRRSDDDYDYDSFIIITSEMANTKEVKSSAIGEVFKFEYEAIKKKLEEDSKKWWDIDLELSSYSLGMCTPYLYRVNKQQLEDFPTCASINCYCLNLKYK